MVIYGDVTCIDKQDFCLILGTEEQTGYVYCLDSTDCFQACGFVINQTISLPDSSTFAQGQELNQDSGLFLSLDSPKFIPVPNSYTYFDPSDGSTVTVNLDGYYKDSKPFDPIWINYGIFYTADNSNWTLDGYRFRDPMNPQVGTYYANMIAPQRMDTTGAHKIQWLYQKDASSYAVAVDQRFFVNSWGNGPPPPYTGPAGTQVEVVPQSQGGNLGDTAVFTIIIHSPIPGPLFYNWRKGGDLILTDNSNFSGTTTDTLIIRSITMDDYDFYECIVSDTVLSTKSWLIVDPP
jgi:hypothetical protein